MIIYNLLDLFYNKAQTFLIFYNKLYNNIYLRGINMRFRYIFYKLLYRHYQLNTKYYINLLHFISIFISMIIYIYLNILNIIIYIKLKLRWNKLQSIKNII